MEGTLKQYRVLKAMKDMKLVYTRAGRVKELNVKFVKEHTPGKILKNIKKASNVEKDTSVK